MDICIYYSTHRRDSSLQDSPLKGNKTWTWVCTQIFRPTLQALSKSYGYTKAQSNWWTIKQPKPRSSSVRCLSERRQTSCRFTEGTGMLKTASGTVKHMGGNPDHLLSVSVTFNLSALNDDQSPLPPQHLCGSNELFVMLDHCLTNPLLNNVITQHDLNFMFLCLSPG